MNILSKSFHFLLFIVIVSIPSLASAKITFDLDFAEAPGTGFHTRPQAKQALLDALSEVADWFDDSYETVLRFKVNSFVENSLEGASYRPFKPENLNGVIMEYLLPGVNPSRVERAILESEVIDGYHGFFDVNFFHS